MPIATPTWINRVWQEFRAGNLTRAARDVLLTLHSYRGHGGVAWPSQVTLGERANCDERTVRRALAAARDLGLVHWTERRVRAGWRWLRTSNLYRFVVPVAPVHLFYGVQKPRAPAAALPDIAAGERRVTKKEALDEMLREAAAAPDLLLARRLAWNEGRLLTTRGG
jgi:Helix-turn-helix domain